MLNLTQMLMQKWGRIAVRQATNRHALLLTTSAMMAMLLVGCGGSSSDGDSDNTASPADIAESTTIMENLFYRMMDPINNAETDSPGLIRVVTFYLDSDEDFVSAAKLLEENSENVLTLVDFLNDGEDGASSIVNFSSSKRDTIEIDIHGSITTQLGETESVYLGSFLVFFNTSDGTATVVDISENTPGVILNALLKHYDLDITSKQNEVEDKIDENDGYLELAFMMEDQDEDGNPVDINLKLTLKISDDSIVFGIVFEGEVVESGTVSFEKGYVNLIDGFVGDDVDLDTADPQESFENMMNALLQLKSADELNNNPYFSYADTDDVSATIEVDSSSGWVGFDLSNAGVAVVDTNAWDVPYAILGEGVTLGDWAGGKLDDIDYTLFTLPALNVDNPEASFVNMMNALLQLKSADELNNYPYFSYADTDDVSATIEVDSSSGWVGFDLSNAGVAVAVVDTDTWNAPYAILGEGVTLEGLKDDVFDHEDYLVTLPDLDADNIPASFVSMMNALLQLKSADELNNYPYFSYADTDDVSATIEVRSSSGWVGFDLSNAGVAVVDTNAWDVPYAILGEGVTLEGLKDDVFDHEDYLVTLPDLDTDNPQNTFENMMDTGFQLHGDSLDVFSYTNPGEVYSYIQIDSYNNINWIEFRLDDADDTPIVDTHSVGLPYAIWDGEGSYTLVELPTLDTDNPQNTFENMMDTGFQVYGDSLEEFAYRDLAGVTAVIKVSSNDNLWVEFDLYAPDPDDDSNDLAIVDTNLSLTPYAILKESLADLAADGIFDSSDYACSSNAIDDGLCIAG